MHSAEPKKIKQREYLKKRDNVEIIAAVLLSVKAVHNEAEMRQMNRK